MAVTLDKKSWGKNPPRRHLQKNPSTVRPPPRPTDDLAEFEPGTSVTDIRAETFRKTAMPLDRARLVWLMSGAQPNLYSMAHL